MSWKEVAIQITTCLAILQKNFWTKLSLKRKNTQNPPLHPLPRRLSPSPSSPNSSVPLQPSTASPLPVPLSPSATATISMPASTSSLSPSSPPLPPSMTQPPPPLLVRNTAQQRDGREWRQLCPKPKPKPKIVLAKGRHSVWLSVCLCDQEASPQLRAQAAVKRCRTVRISSSSLMWERDGRALLPSPPCSLVLFEWIGTHWKDGQTARIILHW